MFSQFLAVSAAGARESKLLNQRYRQPHSIGQPDPQGRWDAVRHITSRA